MISSLSVPLLCATCWLGAISTVTGQVVDPRDFFPLAVGNTWQYITPHSRPGISMTRTIVEDTVNAAGDTLFGCSHVSRSSTQPSMRWYHIDSLYRVFAYSDVNDTSPFFVYKLDAKVGERWHPSSRLTVGWMEVIARDTISDHGQTICRMTVEYYISSYDHRTGDTLHLYPERHTLVAGLGAVEFDHEPLLAANLIVLRGAIVNGNHYGNTSGVEDMSDEPLELDLSAIPGHE